jgi:chloramphenicol-sensitive protein RarD
MQRGNWYGIAAYGLWGLGPIFWNLVDGIPALELLADRIFWSLPLLALVISIQRQWSRLRNTYRDRRTVALATVGGGLIAVNWGVFVWAVTSDHIVEASLGYFIGPLVSVALGVLVLHEYLRPVQRLAVGIAGIGVAVMAVWLGVVPWISLTLAFSFGVYGLLKKQPRAAPAVAGLFGEVLPFSLVSAVYLAMLAADGTGALGTSPAITTWLIAAGAFTVLPLLLFGTAAQLIPLSTLGVLQYLTPTMHFVIGVTIYGEQLLPAQLFGFTMVWIALIIFVGDGLRSTRPLERTASP